MRNIYWIALILTVIGGINWGLVGLLQLDLVATIFGAGSPLANIVYIVVGVAAVATLVLSCKVACPSHVKTTKKAK